MPPEYLTIEDAARELGLAPESVKKAIQKGQIVPAFRGVQIAREQVEHYRQHHLGRRGQPRKVKAAE